MRLVLASVLLAFCAAIRIPQGLRSDVQPDESEPSTTTSSTSRTRMKLVVDTAPEFDDDSEFVLGRSSNFVQGKVTIDSPAGSGVKFVPTDIDHV